jgi:hypothetical protein
MSGLIETTATAVCHTSSLSGKGIRFGLNLIAEGAQISVLGIGYPSTIAGVRKPIQRAGTLCHGELTTTISDQRRE